jgi:hypothetical protein
MLTSELLYMWSFVIVMIGIPRERSRWRRRRCPESRLQRRPVWEIQSKHQGKHHQVKLMTGVRAQMKSTRAHNLSTWGMKLLGMAHWMMKSMDLTIGDALYLYTICPILPDFSDFFPYKGSLFLWFCIEPPRHAWRRPAIQHQCRALGRSLIHMPAAYLPP